MARLTDHMRRTVVVDLGRGTAKLALAETAGEAARFRGICELEPPVAADGSVDTDALIERLRAVVHANQWRGLSAACLLSKSETSTQTFLLPAMPDQELREALRLQLGETLHFDVDEAVFDYRIVREVEEDGDTQLLVLVVTALRSAVERAVRILRATGLLPRAIGAASESLANLTHRAALCAPDEATIHVDIGRDSTILNLFEGRLLRFSRELHFGGDDFTQALLRPILTEHGAVQLSWDEASAVREAFGFPREDEEPVEFTQPEVHGVSPSDVLPLVEPVGQRLVTELDRSIDYLCSLLRRDTVDRIVLSGSAATYKNLDSMLTENLAAPVAPLDPVQRAMDHWRLAICDESYPSLRDFGAILGYSLGNHKPINLLPREALVEEAVDRLSRLRRPLMPAALALATCLSLVAIPIHRQYGQANTWMQSDREGLEERLEASAILRAELEASREERSLLGAARGTVPAWSAVLRELAAVLPPEVQLLGLEVEREEDRRLLTLDAAVHLGPLPTEAIHLQSTTALSESPFFADVRVHRATVAVEENPGQFKATMELIGRDGAPEMPQ